MVMICDVQNRKSDMKYRLTKVGVTGMKKPIYISRPGRADIPLVCTIDIFVDLPADQKGSHMSRNPEAVMELIGDGPCSGIEDFAAELCIKLLEKHEYASVTNVIATADYFKNNVTPNGKVTTEVYKLTGKAVAERSGRVRKTLAVEAIGMTACPCAQENVSQKLGCSKEWPVITHNQRNVCTVSITADKNAKLEADDIIDLINDSFSSPTLELLKRDDEASVVINAHNNPKFVEDMVRNVIDDILAKYPDLPDDTELTVKSESEESIHKHNAFSECTASFGELRN